MILSSSASGRFGLLTSNVMRPRVHFLEVTEEQNTFQVAVMTSIRVWIPRSCEIWLSLVGRLLLDNTSAETLGRSQL